MDESIKEKLKPEDIMWQILTSDCTAIEAEKMSSLLSLHGVASEEYLSFCDDVSLDELSYSLKPTPRRMFEYYRKRLWQPYDCTEELIPFGTSQVSTIADVEESHEKISQVMHGSDRSQDSSDTLGEVSSLERSKCFQNSEKLEDNNHEISIHCKPTALQSSDAACRSSTESEMNFTGKSKTASLASKLTLFFGDSRVMGYECPEELASSYLEIFDDNVEIAINAFLESCPLEKQTLRGSSAEGETNSKHSDQPQSSSKLGAANSHAVQEERISAHFGESHVERKQILENSFKAAYPAKPTGIEQHVGPVKTICIEEMEKQAEGKKRLGSAAMAAKAYDEAIRRYSEALELSAAGPDSHIYYSNRAAAHCFLKNYECAATDCEAAIRLRADFTKAYSRLGLCNFYLGRYEVSVAAYERAVELEPGNRANADELMKVKKRLQGSVAAGSCAISSLSASTMHSMNSLAGSISGFNSRSGLGSGSGFNSRSVLGSGFDSGGVLGSGFMSGSEASSATKNEEVFLKLQQFLDCKRAIEQTWAGISSGQLERVPRVDTVQLPDMSWNFALRQHNLQGSPVQSMDELYEAAKAANPIFESCMRRIIAVAGLPAACLHMAPLKGKERATEKAKDDYDERESGHGERWLFDIVRGAALCDTEDQLVRMIAALQRSSDIEIVRLKNRFANPTPAGFRDFNLNIRVPIDAHTYHICELQVHCAAIKKMDEVKLSHKIYEYFRTYFRGEAKSVDERLRALEQVASNIGTRGSTLQAIVESALESNDLKHLQNVGALLELLFEYTHKIRILRKILLITKDHLGPEHPATLSAEYKLAFSLKNLGNWVEAQSIFERVLRGEEKVLGLEHSDTLVTACDLAAVMIKLGETATARSLYMRVVRVQERVLGLDHLETLRAVHNLANLLGTVGKTAEARDMFERVMRGQEKALGPEHPDVLSTANNLAHMLLRQGEVLRARALFERVVRGFEKALGPEHPKTLAVVNNLGVVLRNVGEMIEAQALHQRALLGCEKILGSEHPETLQAMRSLAAVLMAQEEGGQARLLFERALRVYEKVLGPEHPETLVTVVSLGSCLDDLGDSVQGQVLLERAVQGSEKVLGPEHPQTLTAMSILAAVLSEQGEKVKARTLFEQALSACEKTFGPEHPQTLTTAVNFALVLVESEETTKARVLYEQTLRTQEKVLGPEHPQTLHTVRHLGVLLNKLGEKEAARMMLERALRGQEKALGPEHHLTLSTLSHLACLLRDLGEMVEARALLERSLRGREKILGPEHPETLDIVDILASVLDGLGEKIEARPLYERALQGWEKALGPEHPNTLLTLANYGMLLKALGEHTKARALLERELRGQEKALGPEHHTTLRAVLNLANLLRQMGEQTDVRALYERALRGFERTMGLVNYETFVTSMNFGIFLASQGELTKARSLLERAQRGFEETLGPQHPHTLQTGSIISALG